MFPETKPKNTPFPEGFSHNYFIIYQVSKEIKKRGKTRKPYTFLAFC